MQLFQWIIELSFTEQPQEYRLNTLKKYFRFKFKPYRVTYRAGIADQFDSDKYLKREYSNFIRNVLILYSGLCLVYIF